MLRSRDFTRVCVAFVYQDILYTRNFILTRELHTARLGNNHIENAIATNVKMAEWMRVKIIWRYYIRVGEKQFEVSTNECTRGRVHARARVRFSTSARRGQRCRGRFTDFSIIRHRTSSGVSFLKHQRHFAHWKATTVSARSSAPSRPLGITRV